MKRSIVLIGMMGAGKSAVGAELGRRLGVPVRDTDTEIQAAAAATIPEIFARDGEPFFRDREAEVIGRLLAGPPAVLSTGGGAFLAERNRRAVAGAGVAVWLDADLDTLWERVRHKDTRPLLRGRDPRAVLDDLARVRNPIYAEAHLRVSSQAAPHEATVSAILKAIGR